MGEWTPEEAAEVEAEFAAVLKHTSKFLRRNPEFHFAVVLDALVAGSSAALTAVGYSDPPDGFFEKFQEVLNQVAELADDSGHAVRTAETYRIYKMAARESEIAEEKSAIRDELAAKFKMTPDKEVL